MVCITEFFEAFWQLAKIEVRRAFSGITLAVLLIGVFVSAFNVQPANANGTIYIRVDGSIAPSTAPVSTLDKITYTLTNNIFDSIVIERNNVVVDGAGYAIQGTGIGAGIELVGRSNVAIKNMTIIAFQNGIHLEGSSNNNIDGNNITANNEYGIWLNSSNNNSVRGNNITNQGNDGIRLDYSFGNSASENNMTNNGCGVYLYSSNNNGVSGNYIKANNWSGVALDYSSNNNSVSGNNITANNRNGVVLGHSSNNNNSIIGNYIAANNMNGIGLYHSPNNNNSISGNNIVANNMNGVYLEYSSGNSVSVNNITANNDDGIYLFSSNSNSVTGNNITNNGRDAIYLDSSSNNSIVGNTLTANIRHGVALVYSSYNSIIGNVFTNDGLGAWGSYGNIVEDNFVNGKPLVYLESVSGFTVENAGQVVLVNCDNILVENLNISSTSTGIDMWNITNTRIAGNNITNNYDTIHLSYCSNITIAGNNITNNTHGLVLRWSSSNIISENNITTNDEWGIYLLDSSSNNSIVGNNITNNDRGIWLETSNNKFYYNNFIGNIQQVYYSGYANVWDDGYPSGGNYWSTYAGKDANGDGIGDTPYIMNVNNRDRYPLMKPYPWGPHDIGIISVTTSKTIVGQGENLTINITIFNYGNNTEIFNVTVYANTTIIDTLTDTTLTSRSSTNITLTWNTTSLARGNYTIKAYATPVPDETETTDNTHTNSTVKVAMQSDLNADGTVDILDITIVAIVFDSYIEDSRYNSDADINNDGTIDILDITIVAVNFGKTA